MPRVKNNLLSVYEKEIGVPACDIYRKLKPEYIHWLNERINTALDTLVLLSIDTEKYIRQMTSSDAEAKQYIESSGITKVNESILILSGMAVEDLLG